VQQYLQLQVLNKIEKTQIYSGKPNVLSKYLLQGGMVVVKKRTPTKKMDDVLVKSG
jgi:hypothetical protein